MLEKQIAFFWTGPMSWMRYLTLWSFRKHNPDWEMELHYCPDPINKKNWITDTDSDINYVGKNYLTEVEKLNIILVEHNPPNNNLSPAPMCDIFQWKWLAQNKGYYADMDILWLKPLAELHEEIKSSDAVFCLEEGAMAIGFVASSEFSLFSDISGSLVSGVINYQHYGSLAIEKAIQSKTGSKGIDWINQLNEIYPKHNIVTLPDKTLYPFLWNELEKIFQQTNTVSTVSVGIHWFGGNPLSRHWNDLITEDHWINYHNTFTNCLRNMIL